MTESLYYDTYSHSFTLVYKSFLLDNLLSLCTPEWRRCFNVALPLPNSHLSDLNMPKTTPEESHLEVFPNNVVQVPRFVKQHVVLLLAEVQLLASSLQTSLSMDYCQLRKPVLAGAEKSFCAAPPDRLPRWTKVKLHLVRKTQTNPMCERRMCVQGISKLNPLLMSESIFQLASHNLHATHNISALTTWQHIKHYQVLRTGIKYHWSGTALITNESLWPELIQVSAIHLLYSHDLNICSWTTTHWNQLLYCLVGTKTFTFLAPDYTLWKCVNQGELHICKDGIWKSPSNSTQMALTSKSRQTPCAH